MALADFLGETAEIKIVDFLLENRDLAYNQTELSQCTGLSRTTIHDKLPKLIYNKLVKVPRTVGRSKLFQIEDNDIIDGLMKAVFANSFMIAEEEMEEEGAFDIIKEEIESPHEERIRYSTLSHHEVEFADATTWKGTIEIREVPIMATPTFTSGIEVSVVKPRYKRPVTV